MRPPRLTAMWQRAFDAAFLRYRAAGLSEDTSIDLAEREAEEQLQKYCDDKYEEQRTK